jgi:NAD(P)-dependent dehydrogenase (short-subunit alcohol dehydrogenase family)
MTMPDNDPIRLIGRWDQLSPDQQQRATTRGLDKIFDPGLRRDIAALIEDVRDTGDEALVRALKTFDGCEVAPARRRVTEEEFAAARATVSQALLSAIRDGIDHVRRFNEQITARGDWSFESEPGLIVGEPGAIVFTASVNALRPEPNFLDYNTSKAAVAMMAKSFALELGAAGVSVTALCPGYFPTRMTAGYLDDEETGAQILSHIPAGRIGDLGEIAAVVDFLLSPGAAYMTGSIVSVDGGSSI